MEVNCTTQKSYHIDLDEYLPSPDSSDGEINLGIKSQQPQERNHHSEQQLQVLLVDLRWDGLKS